MMPSELLRTYVAVSGSSIEEAFWAADDDDDAATAAMAAAAAAGRFDGFGFCCRCGGVDSKPDSAPDGSRRSMDNDEPPNKSPVPPVPNRLFINCTWGVVYIYEYRK